MAFPDGWEWLQEVPDEWEPPAELRTPTALPRINLPLQMLAMDILSNDSIDLVGQFISESARFNVWFATVAKGSGRTPKELAMVGQAPGNQLRKVYEAWKDFRGAYERCRGDIQGFLGEQKALDAALRRAVEELQEVRASAPES